MELDFGIQEIFTIEALDFEITNAIVITWIIMAALILFSLWLKRIMQKVPSRVQIIGELIVEGGRPVYYIFLELNLAFEEMAGNSVIGNKAMEL